MPVPGAYHIYYWQSMHCAGGVLVIQEKLLESQYSEMKPDDEFLQSFARVVGNDWPHLASLLSLSTRDLMEEMKRQNKTSSVDQALHMLQIWNSHEETTYSKLCERLRTVPKFTFGNTHMNLTA